MAGTDRSQKIVEAPAPVIILCEPQLGENIGAAARAMANFGLWELRLVAPRDGWPNAKAVAAASKADHVIGRVQVFDNLDDAIADLSLLFATTARRRDLNKPVHGPESAMRAMAAHIGGGARGGLLFGRERWGLNNAEIAMSDAIVTLPVEAAFASLNIAQAVLVLAYEWRRTSGQTALPFSETMQERADKSAMTGLFAHLEEALDQAGFFKSAEKRPTMVDNLRTMLSRAGLNAQEVRTLRGVIAALDRRHERPNPTRKNHKL